MITYFKMKKQEWKVKSMFYGLILGVVDEQKDIIELVKKLYVALKDSSAEEMKDKLISSLAEIIHEENKKDEE